MTDTDNQGKQALKRRLSRIEGQIRGLQNMLDEERDCKDVMQQLTAVRSAVQSASLAYLDQLTNECLIDGQSAEDFKQRKEQLKELITMLAKTS